MGKNRLVLGTLSWMLVCLEVNRQDQKWEMQLHDAILSVCCYEDDDIMAVRIFAGLADGTVAVTEVDIWLATREKGHSDICVKCRLGPACAVCGG